MRDSIALKLTQILLPAALLCLPVRPALASSPDTVCGTATTFSQAVVIQTLRMAGTVTGGMIPYTDPVFAQMENCIAAGQYAAAANWAIDSIYFPVYLPRRMAKEMMNPMMNEVGLADSDAEAFIVANLIGSATQPSISNLWSQNATYCFINNTGSGSNPNAIPASDVSYFPAFGACCPSFGTAAMPCCAGTGNGTNSCAPSTNFSGSVTPTINADSTSVSESTFYTVNWKTALQRIPYQQSSAPQIDAGGNVQGPGSIVQLNAQDTGGYMTIQSNPLLSSPDYFAYYAFNAGTNLRGAEYLYEIATGVSLTQLAAAASQVQGAQGADAEIAPRFVPSSDPNFFVAISNPIACIQCHGGGASNISHGYGTVADVFNWVTSDDFNGFAYFGSGDQKAGGVPMSKSLGSNAVNRGATASCGNADVPCNEASTWQGSSYQASQAWDLTDWQQNGQLALMGWTTFNPNNPIKGNGLASLGKAAGSAAQTFIFMTERVIKELCPLGASFFVGDPTIGQFDLSTAGRIHAIAQSAYAADQASVVSSSILPTSVGPFGTIVAQIASDPSCL